MKGLPDLLEPNNIADLEKAMEKISQMVHEPDADKSSIHELPAMFLNHLNIVEECCTDLPLFLRDLSNQGICLTNKTEKSPVEDFIVLQEVAVGDIDVNYLKELSHVKLNECLPLKDVTRLGKKIISVLKSAERSLELGTAFYALVENFFYMLTDKEKVTLIEMVHEWYICDSGSLPSLEKYLQNYSSGIVQCINHIGDHNDIQNDVAKFKNIRNKLLWYLLMVPRETLNRLLIQSLENKLIVPGVINILRPCRALLSLSVSNNVSEGIPVVIDSIASIFHNEAHRWTITEQQDRFVYLLTSLCRQRRATKEKNDEDTNGGSVLDGGKLLMLFVLPNLMKRSQEILMLKLLHRFTQAVGSKEIHFIWTRSIGEKTSNAVQSPELVLLIVELFMEFESKHHQASEICRNILKSLGEKLKGDDVVFEKDTTDFVLFSLRRYHWWIRYAICTWFSHTLSEPKQQVRHFYELLIAINILCLTQFSN
ncbi:unnamed protein product [Strongylus vulgaris]|uniref:Edg1 TPR repeats region domain-containing protein n=1 Tax=Strongylus vulgaris TaxID=40348 RepID=A0A3P7K7Y8_STRVU|nr:unnamed protein product [Strongylus vulgaris]